MSSNSFLAQEVREGARTPLLISPWCPPRCREPGPLETLQVLGQLEARAPSCAGGGLLPLAWGHCCCRQLDPRSPAQDGAAEGHPAGWESGSSPEPGPLGLCLGRLLLGPRASTPFRRSPLLLPSPPALGLQGGSHSSRLPRRPRARAALTLGFALQTLDQPCSADPASAPQSPRRGVGFSRGAYPPKGSGAWSPPGAGGHVLLAQQPAQGAAPPGLGLL